MDQQNRPVAKQLRKLFYIVIIGGLLGFLLILIILQVTGRGLLGNEAHLTEFRVCLNDTRYEPVDEVPTGTTVFFVCGVIEGQGMLQGVLHLYRDDQMIDSKLFESREGTFHEQFAFEDGVTVGDYTIDFFVARQVIEQTEFSVR